MKVRLFGFDEFDNYKTLSMPDEDSVLGWYMKVPKTGIVWLFGAEYDDAFPENGQEFFEQAMRYLDSPSCVVFAGGTVEGMKKSIVDWGTRRGIYRVNKVEMKRVDKPGPRKPPPALPVEVYSTAKFDAEKAWEAIVQLSKGM